MSDYVRSITASCLYGRYDLNMDFSPGINVVHGRNGSGKTTLLHILANILNGEYYRFVFLPFNAITAHLSLGTTVTVSKKAFGDELHLVVLINGSPVFKLPVEEAQDVLASQRALYKALPARERRRMVREEGLLEQDTVLGEFQRRLEAFELPGKIAGPLPAAYFPAFRTMIDAWASVAEEEEQSTQKTWASRATYFARRWFGRFIPPVNYPSLLEIENRLSGEVRDARIRIGQADRRSVSEGFIGIFESLSEGRRNDAGSAEEILGEIKSLFDELEDSPLQGESTIVTGVHSKLSDSIHELRLKESENTAIRVLNVYRKLLKNVVRVQKESFRVIQQYVQSVNKFLEGKELTVDPGVPVFRGRSVGISFGSEDEIEELRVLSSGERQIATLIYAATHMSKQKVVLIDEPEISLHVDWQRRLLGEMSEQVGERQIIACTHSPSIGADYPELQREIELRLTSQDLVVAEDADPKGMQEALF